MSNPFLIEGPAAVGVSGGRTSAYMLRRMLDAHQDRLPPNVHLTFENTGQEREETLEFIEELSQKWSVPIRWLEYCNTFDLEDYRKKDGSLSKRARRSLRPFYKIVDFKTASRRGEPFRMMIDYYYQYRTLVKREPPVLPNPVQRLCTANLKIKVGDRFMEDQGFKRFNFYVGIRADEPRRYKKMMAANGTNSQRYWSCCPLYEAGVHKADINRYWQSSDFDLKLDPESNEGNCDLCFLKSFPKIVRIMEKTDKYDRFWMDMEEKTGTVFRRDRPTYREIREMIKNKDPRIQELLEAAGDDKAIDCICGEGD